MQTQQDTTSTQKKPFVSFIIPCYNLPAELVTRCLDSIISLTLSKAEREIIVIDDGSDTPMINLLSAYIDDIIYIRQPNSGLSTARNTGIRASTGTYLQFIDGDDQLICRPYEHCLDLIRYSKPDMVMFDLTNTPDDKVVFEDMPLMNGTELMRTRNIHGSACSYLFKKSALSELRFTPGIYHEDEEFTPLLLLRADTVIATNAKAYLYTERPGSIITQKDTNHRKKRLDDILCIILRLNKIADTLPTEAHIALSRRVHQLTMDHIYNIIVDIRDGNYLKKHLQELHQSGLYPLPKYNYTKKYALFRRLSSTEIGLKMLMRALPLMKKER